MMDTESSYDHHKRTPTKNKAGEFGRPLIPFFLNEENGETPTGGYSVNEDMFITDEQAQQQERVFVPKGEKSIRVREFKDGYFEYKDLSFDNIQEKLTFDSPTKQQANPSHSNSNNGNQAPFFAQHLAENNQSKNTSSNGGNGNGGGLGKKTKTSTRDHFANYQRMVNPYQHVAKSNDNSSSSDENKRLSDEDKQDEDDKKAKKKKQKKKVMVPVNVQKQNVSRHNQQPNFIVSRNDENQVPSSSSSNQQQQEYVVPSSPSYPSIPIHHHPAAVVYPQQPPIMMPHNLIYTTTPSSPIYQKPTTVTNHQQLLTPSLFGIRSPSLSSQSPNNNSSSQSPSTNGLLRPSALLGHSPFSPLKPPVQISSNSTSQKVSPPPTQSYDVSYLENNILPRYYNDQSNANNNYSMNGSVVEQPTNQSAEQVQLSQMVSSNSSASLTEEELLSILMNDGSMNFTPDEPENIEQKHKKFAGGSWSNSPHPSKIPKPNFK